jgi:prolyl 4-hydroxylase
MGILQSGVVVLLATLLTPCLAALPHEKDALIGWEGDTYNKGSVFGHESTAAAPERWVETVSWTPRAFVFHNFLTAQESDHILHTAAIEMRRSTVVAGNSSAVDQIRTSYGMFLPRLRDPTIFRVEQKLANWTQLPIVYQEDIQVCPLAWSTPKS